MYWYEHLTIEEFCGKFNLIETKTDLEKHLLKRIEELEEIVKDYET